EEERAALGKGVLADDDDVPGQITDNLPTHDRGTIQALVIPFVVLVIGVIGGMYVTGGIAAGSWSMLEVMANADVAIALNVGGVAGFLIHVTYCIRITRHDTQVSPGVIASVSLDGAKSMLPASYNLLLAWMLYTLIGELGSGTYFAGLVTSLSVTPIWLIP